MIVRAPCSRLKKSTFVRRIPVGVGLDAVRVGEHREIPGALHPRLRLGDPGEQRQAEKLLDLLRRPHPRVQRFRKKRQCSRGDQSEYEAQQRVATAYIEDGSIAEACPPLQALLTIMATGSFEGKDNRRPDIRKMFTRESLLASAWYRARLETKQRRDIARSNVAGPGFRSAPRVASEICRRELSRTFAASSSPSAGDRKKVTR